MSESEGLSAAAVESALLALSREPKQLERLLLLLLPATTLKELAKHAGKRLPGRPQAEAQLAGLIPRHAQLARQVAEALLSLPQPPAEAELQAVMEALGSGLPEGPGQMETPLAACASLAVAEARRPKPSAASPAAGAKPAAKRETQLAKLKRDLRRVKEQLQQARHLLAEKQEECGNLRRELHELEEAIAEEKARRRDAEQRAASRKKAMKDQASASDREEQLEQEVEKLRRKLNIETQKRRHLAEESEDLRACLEDRDRFDAIPDEDIPSFRNRPLLDRERALAEAMERGGHRFRILVVGGGEPQFRHRDKLEEYAEVMGFESHWRMAEYVSWHKEMDRLASDMNQRYDALVILHWNRTTFTRNARKLCDDAGHKPCITCYYEGFTSLRETIQTCLQQLLDRAAASGAA